MLAEECAELIQAVMKLRRFGQDGAPGYEGVKPREEVIREIGDILVCVDRLVHFKLVATEELERAKKRKRERLFELFGEPSP
jgi:NTP pyrophosphatase (non-canonical NTP hydrolase)